MPTPKLRYLAPILLAFLALIAWNAYRQPSALANNSTSLQLQPPPFIQDAVSAEQSPAAIDIGQKLDAEAGISAYYKAPDEINLSQVKSLFRTIELETADYIIGSVPVPNYAEEIFDTHVYVHKSGWILAYYPKGDPLSKILDLRAMSINTTKLKSAVAVVASTVGAPFSDATYYDFRYPNATNMMLIAEDNSNGNTFTIQLPSSYGYFDRAWGSIEVQCCAYNPYFVLDGVDLPSLGRVAGMEWNTITASQLLPDVEHTISVDDYGVLVILYRIP